MARGAQDSDGPQDLVPVVHSCCPVTRRTPLKREDHEEGTDQSHSVKNTQSGCWSMWRGCEQSVFLCPPNIYQPTLNNTLIKLKGKDQNLMGRETESEQGHGHWNLALGGSRHHP